MIKYLRILNLAVIREVSLEFSPGLTVITGETGAGKSILVDSLALLLGERAGPDLVRSGEKAACVEAVFDLARHDNLRPILKDGGWESEEDEIIFRREILSEGRSRAFIGGKLATLADLRRLGETLVDLHGQHEHQRLLQPSEHLPLLDRYGTRPEMLETMRQTWEALRISMRQQESSTRDRLERERHLDMLRFQVDEIHKADVKRGEMESLHSERDRLRNRGRILELVRSGVEALYEGEVCALGSLEAALLSGRELARYDSEVAAALPRAEEAKLALKELSEVMRKAGREEEENPGRLDEIEARLSRLEGLLRKYGPDEEALLSFQQAREAELETLTSSELSAQALEERVRSGSEVCARQAAALSEGRSKAARSLEAAVGKELAQLGLAGTDFRVELGVEENAESRVTRDSVPVACGASGWDRARFLLRANPGEPHRPVSRTASGGETSRIMLAIHLVLQKGKEGTTRVFDEVDAGIGGGVAQTVGSKLRDLGRGGQVLCVTHLPQIASLADHHLSVTKRVRHGRTEVGVQSLDREGAVREVARMLGGARVSELTLRHAAEMVERGR
ncbi:MAG TPA: DNA repair protein RecN [Candidatus Polarisedimenticolia bacterium]|nr:DNA repair protein RecN [Candidatus Polarisedimenticolia bacterium]